MSWGERSCKRPCRVKPGQCEPNTCDVDCPGYEWDGKTPPDSRSSKPDEIAVSPEERAGKEGKAIMDKIRRTHPGCVFPEDHQPRQVTKISRNAPCPCGSGKKYKRCCNV